MSWPGAIVTATTIAVVAWVLVAILFGIGFWFLWRRWEEEHTEFERRAEENRKEFNRRVEEGKQEFEATRLRILGRQEKLDKEIDERWKGRR